jgi:hypothetical protein
LRQAGIAAAFVDYGRLIVAAGGEQKSEGEGGNAKHGSGLAAQGQ